MSHAVILFPLALTENSQESVGNLEVSGFRNCSDCSTEQRCAQLLRFDVFRPEQREPHSPHDKADLQDSAPVVERGGKEVVKQELSHLRHHSSRAARLSPCTAQPCGGCWDRALTKAAAGVFPPCVRADSYLHPQRPFFLPLLTQIPRGGGGRSWRDP